MWSLPIIYRIRSNLQITGKNITLLLHYLTEDPPMWHGIGVLRGRGQGGLAPSKIG